MVALNFHQIPDSPRKQRFRFLRFLFLPSLTATALLLTGALGQQAPPSVQSSPPAASPAKADPAGERILKLALEELDPKKLGWLQTRLRQQVQAQGLSFEADGRYLAGPDHRLRLELAVHLGETDAALQIISDGRTVWDEVRIGKGDPAISKWDLKKVQETLQSPGTLPQTSDQFYRSQSFAGVVPLLQNIHDQMTVIKQEETEWQKHAVLKLTAVWSPDIRKTLVSQNNPWPPLLPRTCSLYLGKLSPHWLYCVQWRGPTSARGEDSLLMQMEFLNPQFRPANQKPPADFSRQFTFDPGKAKVLDRTQDVTNFIALLVRNQTKTPTNATNPTGVSGPR
jgi:hypothetical protein